jgi:hypothetical protein
LCGALETALSEWVTDKDPAYGTAPRELCLSRAVHVQGKRSNNRSVPDVAEGGQRGCMTWPEAALIAPKPSDVTSPSKVSPKAIIALSVEPAGMLEHLVNVVGHESEEER